MNCIFCKIIEGEIPSHKVYEDDKVFAFLDINPIRPGHTLVIPKYHEENFYDLELETYRSMMKAIKKLSKKIEQEIKPGRVAMMALGWDVPHAHIHIVPMENSQDITTRISGKAASEPNHEELAKIADQIKIDSLE